MNLSELIENVKKIERDSIRDDQVNRLELVVQVARLPEINSMLTSFFGPPKKPAGEQPSGDTKKVTERYGGILKDQTLYSKAESGNSYLAMIWPWQDKARATVKIFSVG